MGGKEGKQRDDALLFETIQVFKLGSRLLNFALF